MPDATLLIADIGGTNARFALANPHDVGFSEEQILQCAEFASADEAIQDYLDQAGAPRPDAICLAAAGPVVNGRVRFTNNPWTLDAAALKQSFQTGNVRLLNDFEAVAWSIPLLSQDDLIPIGLPEPGSITERDYTIAVVGPGTGLGAVGLKSVGGQLIPIVGEASHAGFAPESLVQVRVLQQLRERFDRVSDERLVSGSGLENIYWALAQMHGDKQTSRDVADIFADGLAHRESRAAEAVELLFEILGQVAGDYALAMGAADGVYIGGGIVKRYPEALLNSRFRSGFENKGGHRPLMERIPTQLITHPEPGLLGAAYCAAAMQTS